jgi:T5SS/PEP-CTERM-associated repeat protein
MTRFRFGNGLWRAISLPASNRVFTVVLILISLALAIAPIRPARAQFGFLYSWNKAAGGSYAINSNWTPVGIPDAANEGAQFDLNATYSVQVANNYTVGSLNALNGNTTLAFQPQGFIGPPLTFTAGSLNVSPVDSSNSSLTASGGNITVSGSTLIDSGSSGTSKLLISSGALTTSATTVGSQAGSSGNLTIDEHSSWTSTATVVIGSSGSGDLEMVAGIGGSFGGTFPAQSTATTAGATLGQSVGGKGTANIAGGWNTGNLIVGNAGTGVVNLLGTEITDPSPLSSVGYLTSANASIAAQPGSTGNVNVTETLLNGLNIISSAWNVTGSLALGGTTSAAGGAGAISIGPLNSVTVGSNLKVWPGGTLALAQGGTLDISGAANLGGDLKFSLSATPDPHAGDSFQILSATGGVSGTFASTMLPTLDPGLSWKVVYSSTNVSLTVVSGLAGDFNSNGVVDAADYVAWRNNIGSTTALPNDSIGGTIGPAQYNEWRSHFGQTSGSGSGAIAIRGAAVPEPPAAMLMIAAAICMVARRRIV